MIKRTFDIVVSAVGLLLSSPVLLIFMLAVWLQDRHSPFYIAPRVGKNGVLFNMVKMRSMVVNADKSGVDSTAADDPRITKVGNLIRKFKIDELTQLWNVLKGDMSLVGPRPQVQRDVDLYTDEERKLLSVKPGITDFSSIVFADENDILEGKTDPDLSYNQLIRPWKSRLGLFYIKNRSIVVDIILIMLTVLNSVNRKFALSIISLMLRQMDADPKFINVCKRNFDLKPFPPPGTDTIVVERT